MSFAMVHFLSSSHPLSDPSAETLTIPPSIRAIPVTMSLCMNIGSLTSPLGTQTVKREPG